MADSVSPAVLGVYRESVPDDRRVALTPPVVARVRDFGLDVLVETGAGQGAGFPDDAYRQSGARIVRHDHLLDAADLLAAVSLPGIDASHRFRSGQILFGLLAPTRNAALMRRWAESGLTALSLDLVPRELPGLRPLDAAGSQHALSGCRAALLALRHLDRLTPGDCAAPDEDGPPRPRALVVGSGADARQAALTLARLGASTHLWSPDAIGLPEGVLPLHLRPGPPAHSMAQTVAESLAEELPAFEVVVTALRDGDAAIPLVDESVLGSLVPGSVIVDLTADRAGGNVPGADPDGTPRVSHGVTVIAAPELAAQVPRAASSAYARTVEAVLARLLASGRPRIDPTDPFQAATLVTHNGEVVHEPTWQRVLGDMRSAGLP